MWELLFNFLRLTSAFGSEDYKWYRMVEDLYHDSKDLSFWTNQELWNRLWKEVNKNISEAMHAELEKSLRRRMNKTRTSRGNNYNLQDFFTTWMKLDNKQTVKTVLIRSLRKYLAYDLKLSGSLVKRGVQAFTNTALSGSAIKKWFYKHYTKAVNSKWYYLTNTHHSDHAIYKMRTVGGYYKDSPLGLTNMQVQFIETGTGKLHDDRIPYKLSDATIERPKGAIINLLRSDIYEYARVPVVICCIMINIPLTYLTKNGYLAGAWNFFWYSCITTQRVDADVYGQHPSTKGTVDKNGRFHPEPAYMTGPKKKIEAMRQARLQRIMSQPIHKLKNKMFKPITKGGKRKDNGNRHRK